MRAETGIEEIIKSFGICAKAYGVENGKAYELLCDIDMSGYNWTIRDFNGFFDAIDQGISFFTGRRFSSNAEQRLMMAIKSLDSEQFSTETINKMIGSTKFLQAAQSGMIPYINANQLSAPEEQLSEDDEVEFDNERNVDNMLNHWEQWFDKKFGEGWDEI